MGWVENATPEVDTISEWRLIIGVVVSLTVISVSVVVTRLRVRSSAHGLQWDDWFATVSMVFAVLYSFISIMQTKYGLGLPIKLRPTANLIPFTRWNYAGRPIYQMGISFFKVALLISYLRLFQGTSHVAYRRVVRGAIALVVAGHLGCSLALIFACSPVHKSWEPLVVGACLPPGPSFTGYAAVTIMSDIVVTIIPIPVLLQLNVSRGKKIGLVVIFVLGLFTTLCSVFRYLQIDRIQNGDGNSTMLVLWGVVEFNVGNMVSSLPFLAPVFLRKAKQIYGSSGNNSKPGPKSSESYKLSSMSQGKGVFASATKNRTASEEDILQDAPGHSILKSVTYSVQVDEPKEAKLGRK